jgi:hypothetical protein
MIRDAIANGIAVWHADFDQSLFQLLQAREITYEEATTTPPTPTSSRCAFGIFRDNADARAP